MILCGKFIQAGGLSGIYRHYDKISFNHPIAYFQSSSGVWLCVFCGSLFAEMTSELVSILFKHGFFFMVRVVLLADRCSEKRFRSGEFDPPLHPQDGVYRGRSLPRDTGLQAGGLPGIMVTISAWVLITQ